MNRSIVLLLSIQILYSSDHAAYTKDGRQSSQESDHIVTYEQALLFVQALGNNRYKCEFPNCSYQYGPSKKKAKNVNKNLGFTSELIRSHIDTHIGVEYQCSKCRKRFHFVEQKSLHGLAGPCKKGFPTDLEEEKKFLNENEEFKKIKTELEHEGERIDMFLDWAKDHNITIHTENIDSIEAVDAVIELAKNQGFSFSSKDEQLKE